MSSFNLSDREQQHFNELFSSLDTEKQKKLDLRQTSEYLSKCDLPIDQFEQILEVCGANRLGHFGRSQFYIALKLIALAQNAYELSADNLSKLDIPLPVFYCERSDNHRQVNKNATQLNSPDANLGKKSGYLPPPPSSANKNVRNRLGQHMQRLSLDSSFVLNNSHDAADVTASRLNSISNTLQKSAAKLAECNSVANGNYAQLTNKEEESIGSECSSPEFISNEQTNGSFFTPLKPWQELESRHQQIGGPEQAAFLHVEDDAHHHLLGNDEDEPSPQTICVLNGPTVNTYRCFTNEDEDMEDQIKLNVAAENALGESKVNELGSNERRPSTEDNLNWINDSCDYKHKMDEDEDEVWIISDQQLRYFHSKFVELSNNTCKPLAGNEVRCFLEKSKLPLPDLKKIWQLSDLDQDGQLSLTEFCIAVHLIVLRRNHVDLPDVLPKNLQPERWAYRLSLLGLQTCSNIEPSEISLLDQPMSPPVIKEWTKFSNSPEPNSMAEVNKISTNNSSENLLELPMKPVNFDHVELDPRIPHPIAVKGTQLPPVQRQPRNVNEPNTCKSQLTSSASPTALANCHLPPPPRPARTSGHTRSSSLDLSRKVNDSVVLNNDHQSAFTNYRRHVQHQQMQHLQKKAKSQNLNKHDYINLLKSKYLLVSPILNPTDLTDLPKEKLLEICMQYAERLHSSENTIELLINELAVLLAEKGPVSTSVSASVINGTTMQTNNSHNLR